MIVGMAAIEDACVLIVEDNDDARKVVAYRLRRMGVGRVAEAANGLEALDAVRTEEPDLILMDVCMPVMDGIAAMAAIRALPGPIASVPIIALTAATAPGDRERCIQAGASDYLAKPVVDPRLLTDKIHQWLAINSNGEKNLRPAGDSPSLLA